MEGQKEIQHVLCIVRVCLTILHELQCELSPLMMTLVCNIRSKEIMDISHIEKRVLLPLSRSNAFHFCPRALDGSNLAPLDFRGVSMSLSNKAVP